MTCIPPALVWGRVGSEMLHIGSAMLGVGSAMLGVGSASPTRAPDVSRFAFQWNIDFTLITCVIGLFLKKNEKV